MKRKRNYEEVVGWKRLEQPQSDTGSRCVALESAATPSAAAFGSSLKSRFVTAAISAEFDRHVDMGDVMWLLST